MSNQTYYIDAELQEHVELASKQTGLETERIRKAFDIASQFPIEGIDFAMKRTSPIFYILQTVHFGEAVEAAQYIGKPPRLMKKLLSKNPQSGLAEAHVIRRIVQIAKNPKDVEYEPNYWRKKPDIVHKKAGDDKIAFEVINVELASLDREMWNVQQKVMSNKLSTVVGYSGPSCLDHFVDGNKMVHAV